MTAVTAPTDVARQGLAPPQRHRHVVKDAITMAWRNILNLKRTPELVMFATIQPIIFVLMFTYVFGGALNNAVGDVPYIDFLMPGVFVQTIVFGALSTGVGLAEDLQKGLIDRFRSLPMARSAVLMGRTLADLLRNVFVLLLMSVVGFLVGWRIHTNFWGYLGAVLITLAFSYSLSWVFAIIGLTTKNAETTQAASFPILAVLVFASSAFVPVASMPSWLQPWAENQPVSVVIDAARALTIGGPTLEACLKAIGWIIVIVAACAPLAVHLYRRVT
jgi:ABC-2 type transport system permease protein/oleandomycin transport system permease protein